MFYYMSSININTNFTYGSNSIPMVNSCGVYFYDGKVFEDGGGSLLRPIPCSIYSFDSKIRMNDSIDAVILYPGFKVILYIAYEYGQTATTIENDYKDKIIIRYLNSFNAMSSCQVYYQGTEIKLDGISNNSTITKLNDNKTETITGTTSVIT